MADIPKRVKRILRECAAAARKEGLRRALVPIAEALKGQMSATPGHWSDGNGASLVAATWATSARVIFVRPTATQERPGSVLADDTPRCRFCVTLRSRLSYPVTATPAVSAR